MIKRIFILACFFIALKAAAQDQIIAHGDTLVLPNGSKFWLGETVTLGSGSAQDRSFNFIYFPIPLNLAKGKGLNARYAGQTATIGKFARDAQYKNSYSYNILVLEFGDRRMKKKYWCDIQGALNSKEIIDNSAPPASVAPPDSKDARLAKLKKLYDSGQLSKDDYETLRDKILNEKDAKTKPASNSGPVVF